MERVRRIELLALAWKAKVLPLYDTRLVIYISITGLLHPVNYKIPSICI